MENSTPYVINQARHQWKALRTTPNLRVYVRSANIPDMISLLVTFWKRKHQIPWWTPAPLENFVMTVNPGAIPLSIAHILKTSSRDLTFVLHHCFFCVTWVDTLYTRTKLTVNIVDIRYYCGLIPFKHRGWV